MPTTTLRMSSESSIWTARVPSKGLMPSPLLPDPIFLSGSLTGAYSINSNGAGSLTVSLDFGVTATFSIVVTDGGSGILMLQTDASDGFAQVLSGTARMQ